MSKNNSNNVHGGGIGFCGALTIALIVLKLCNFIQWSWLWIFSPIWVPTLLIIGALLWIISRN